MKKVCVLIRVYNRLDDLKICIEAIKKYWKKNEYSILVVSNGKNQGYEISEEIKKMADKVVELEENAGHVKGNSQLVMEGIKYIPEETEYTIILEADTWIFSDEVIDKYINILDKSDTVWASAEWIKKYWSLALDMAIIKNSFINGNEAIFDYSNSPESYIGNYLLDRNYKFVYIKENMPVHRPNSMKRIYNAYGGRFRMFPKAKMVTHHIEDLENGMETKKLLANVCLGYEEFNLDKNYNLEEERKKMNFRIFLANILPNSSWFRAKKKKN